MDMDERILEQLYLSCLVQDCDNSPNGMVVRYNIGDKTYTSWICSEHARMVSGSPGSYSIGPLNSPGG